MNRNRNMLNGTLGDLSAGSLKGKRIKRDIKRGDLRGKIKVVLDHKTTVYVDDENKIEEVRKRYKDLDKFNNLKKG